MSILFLCLLPSISQAEEDEYTQVSNQVLVSPHNMEGKAGWYVCTTNCEPWGLKEGQWHKHLGDFQWQGHKPTAPVHIYVTDKEGEVVEEIENEPEIDKEALFNEGFKKGETIGYGDGLEQKTYEDKIVDAEIEEIMLEGYKEGYKKGYNKGKEEVDESRSEVSIKEKGKKDGYTNYRYGASKDYLASEDKNISMLKLYQDSFDQGWNQAEQEFYEKFPFMKWLEWNHQGITLLHILVVGTLLIALIVIKTKKAKKKKLTEDIYTKK